jgi:hypothetical protein
VSTDPVSVHAPYPARLSAQPVPEGLSPALWLVKWLLIIPHAIVLAFLWAAFAVLTVVAFVAIVFTARYPRGIFDFNVGVLRWTWRVAYYSYSALGTDTYPPFTLRERPEYPATVAVAYPERLSRGLVLVKWWLLAIPHYVVVGLLVGPQVSYETVDGTKYASHIGLIGILVLVAAVVLLFTSRYPRSVYDLVIGLNRWVYRVAAYASLMTDVYPPFRLDQGAADDGPGGGGPPS